MLFTSARNWEQWARINFTFCCLSVVLCFTTPGHLRIGVRTAGVMQARQRVQKQRCAPYIFMQHKPEVSIAFADKKSVGTKLDVPSSSAKKGGVGEVPTGFNIAKAIVGAGSFALPWACKNEGVAGGMITILAAGVLASVTKKWLIECKDQMERETGRVNVNYVELAKYGLGSWGGYFVFAMTAASSLGVCSSYVAFISSTLALLSQQDGTWLHEMVPTWTKEHYEMAVVGLIAPVTWLRSFKFLSFTSTIGVLAVAVAMCATVAEGMEQLGSTDALLSAFRSLPLWPQSIESYAASFGSVIFLMCVNFLIFPIERAMSRRENFGPTLDATLVILTLANAAFAVLGFTFFGAQTSDIVTNNLGAGLGLTAIKVLVCMDLLCTYPLIFVSGREIIERLLLPSVENENGVGQTHKDASTQKDSVSDTASPASSSLFESSFVGVQQGMVRSGLVALTWLISHENNFGLITNVVGGFAQGSLAFIIPPALSFAMRGDKRPVQQAMEILLIAFGVASAGLVTYQAISSYLA